jgi:SPOR domain
VKRGLLVLLPAALACGGAPPQTEQLREAVATAGAPPASGVAFRLPARNGEPRLYELPDLAPLAADLDPGPATDRLIGFAPDDDLLYSLAGGELLALDLRIGRFRTLDSGVVHAAVDATGTVVLARADGGLAQGSDRRVSPVGHLPPHSRLELLWSAPGGRTAAVVRGDSGRRLIVLSGGTLASSVPLPDGPVARTVWGDAVAIGGPEGIELRELLREAPPVRIRLRPGVLALAFSASGHRLYAATDAPAVQVFDRFDGDALLEIAVPGPVTALRADEFGRYLFGVTGDALVLLDVRGDTAMVRTGIWGDDLPAAGPDGTILVRRGDDVVAVTAVDSTPTGRVAGGARDRWLVAPWSPRRQALAVAPTDAPVGAVAAPGQEIFVQVSSTSNAQWAEGLAADLRLAGMRATVLPPRSAAEMYRVVLGPYATRDEAETIGRKLGMPYWIFQRDPAAP